MNSKAFSMSITTIVVAVLALLILVVLVGVFTGQFGGFTRGVRDCRSKGGTGECGTAPVCGEGFVNYFGAGLCRGQCPEGQVGICCVRIGAGCVRKSDAAIGTTCAGKSRTECKDSCEWK